MIYPGLNASFKHIESNKWWWWYWQLEKRKPETIFCIYLCLATYHSQLPRCCLKINRWISDLFVTMILTCLYCLTKEISLLSHWSFVWGLVWFMTLTIYLLLLMFYWKTFAPPPPLSRLIHLVYKIVGLVFRSISRMKNIEKE